MAREANLVLNELPVNVFILKGTLKKRAVEVVQALGF